MFGKHKNKKIDFIGIGAAKCGTSWVFQCLQEHPQINMPSNKSLFFFNSDKGNEYVKDNWSHWDRGINWYLSQFPSSEKGKIRGEFGVSYLHDPKAARRIHKNFSDTKILVILRNPADMLHSLYWFNHNTVEARIPSTFEKAVVYKWCLDRGNYYKHLKSYYHLFSPKNIHVMLLDDVVHSPELVVRDLYEFLEVDADFVPAELSQRVLPATGHKSKLLKNIGAHAFNFMEIFKLDSLRNFVRDTPIFYSIYEKLNVVERDYPPMTKKIRENLIGRYSRDIRKLEGLLDKDLSFWK